MLLFDIMCTCEDRPWQEKTPDHLFFINLIFRRKTCQDIKSMI